MITIVLARLCLQPTQKKCYIINCFLHWEIQIQQSRQATMIFVIYLVGTLSQDLLNELFINFLKV